MGEESGLSSGREEEHGGHNGLSQNSGSRSSGNLHSWKWTHAKNHQGIQQNVADQAHRGGPQDHHTAAHGSK